METIVTMSLEPGFVCGGAWPKPEMAMPSRHALEAAMFLMLMDARGDRAGLQMIAFIHPFREEEEEWLSTVGLDDLDDLAEDLGNFGAFAFLLGKLALEEVVGQALPGI